MAFVPSPEQYATDRNLAARQRFWAAEDPLFDIVGWTLDLGGVGDGTRVLDVGCGNGRYLRAMRDRGAHAVGCDMSMGILPSSEGHALANADAMELPFADDSFDVVIAPHMLYHVPDVAAAVREVRRVLRSGGTFVAVTNGALHMETLYALVESVVNVTDAGWRMLAPTTHGFSLENGGDHVAGSFLLVECIRPADPPTVVLRDAQLAADYVASMGDSYASQISGRWDDVVAEVERRVSAAIAQDGAFTVKGDPGAFVCR